MSKFRIKRIDLSRARIRRRRLTARKKHFRMTGGPISGAWLSTPGTMAFRMGEWFGYYDGENKWVAI